MCLGRIKHRMLNFYGMAFGGSMYLASFIDSTQKDSVTCSNTTASNALLLNVIIALHLKKSGPGKFMLPGVIKVSVKNVAAKKARKGLHPLTRKQITFKTKPTSRGVKATVLKLIKTMVI